jgi:cobyric acid synthase
MLLDNEEKKRVIGLLVNQFRGDESLFTEGKNLLEEITGKKILGTIPFVDKHMLPDEDSLSFGARSGENNKSRGKSKNEAIKVFVLKYPHISNFTDFDPFYMESEIEIKFLDEPDNTLPDIFILPGSKNVAGDLEWMEKQGFTRYIMKLRTEGKTEIVGLCGGLQMLGSMINDPHGIENANLDKPGLGLMGISTEMGIDKVLQKFSGRHIQSNIEISGYEIHHGRTNLHETKNEQSPMDVFKNNPEAGFSTPDGMVWGTYVHGIFDNDDFRLWFINKSRARKGMAPLEEIEKYNLEDAIENFAQIVKERIDLTGIKNALGLS